MNSGEAIDGDEAAWQELVAAVRSSSSGDEGYADLVALLSLDEFIDYKLVDIWLENDDWPHDTWYASRDRVSDGPDAAVARVAALAEPVRAAVPAESARWGSYRHEVHCFYTPPCPVYTVDEHWEAEQERLLEEYLPQRAGAVREQLRAHGLWGGY